MIFKAFFTALAFCTRVPVPAKSQISDLRFLYFLPLIGVLLGLALGTFGDWMARTFNVSVSTVALLIIYYWLTAALHLDGLCDCADAFYGNKTKDRVLEIMKDPRVGTMGVTAAILSILLKYSLLQNLDAGMMKCLAAAFGLSRAMPLCFTAFLNYARPQGGIISGESLSRRISLMALIAYTAVFCVIAPIPCAAGVLAGGLFVLYCKRRLGGYTGDCMGASIEITENTVLLAMVVLS